MFTGNVANVTVFELQTGVGSSSTMILAVSTSTPRNIELLTTYTA